MCLKQTGLSLTVLLGSVLGCIGEHHPFYDESEDLGVSNSEYITEVARGGSGYPGASRIDTMYKSFGLTTGRFDRWTRVAISTANYEALWSLEVELIREDGHTSARAADGRVLDRLATREPLRPTDWPPSQFTRPSWWRLPAADTPTEITAWQGTTAENPSDTAYADWGRYWVYDKDAETLWVWWWQERY